ncbi:MAG: thiamine phosphate synthase [Candidatus Omnitrophica bacterium]|nr:thiamine phosphate synthase [Candidatus Omnitrophota bacterium]
MKPRKRLLSKSRLYVILDKKISAGHTLLHMASRLSDFGADIIQFRDKYSSKNSILESALLLRKLFRNSDVLFILNDYLDIAKITDCDGVHLGQNDTSIEVAREILGEDKIFGLSCHNLKQALLAQEKGADYIGIGPIFPTPTKPQYQAIGPDIIKQVKKKIKIPFFPIGGITQYNINQILSLGAKRAAVCRAIIKAKNITQATEYFSGILN